MNAFFAELWRTKKAIAASGRIGKKKGGKREDHTKGICHKEEKEEKLVLPMLTNQIRPSRSSTPEWQEETLRNKKNGGLCTDRDQRNEKEVDDAFSK